MHMYLFGTNLFILQKISDAYVHTRKGLVTRVAHSTELYHSLYPLFGWLLLFDMLIDIDISGHGNFSSKTHLS